MFLLACVLGFSLERALESESPLARRLADNNEPCKESCDEGHDRECDQQDDKGQWTLSCDLHPTTSCDSHCTYPPPPPLDPWMCASGTYPTPPPPPPPPNRTLLVAAWIYFVVALAICLFVLVCVSYRRRGETGDYATYWCCCLLPCIRDKKRGRWDDGGDGGVGMRPSGATSSDLPPVMIK